MSRINRFNILAAQVAYLLLCLILPIGVSSCTPSEGHDIDASHSPTLRPTFLEENTLCEAVPHQLLKDELSLQVEYYNYEHFSTVDREGNNTGTFHCNLYGEQSPPGQSYGLRIGYAPDGKLTANSSEHNFSDLGNRGFDLAPATFEGIEGQGYVWLLSSDNYVSAAWLYPDGHALEIVMFPQNGSAYTYDEAAIEGMRTLLKELVTTIPPVAAGPDLSTVFVPDPNDPRPAKNPTSTPH